MLVPTVAGRDSAVAWSSASAWQGTRSASEPADEKGIGDNELIGSECPGVERDRKAFALGVDHY